MIEAWPQKQRLRPFSIFPELKFCGWLTANMLNLVSALQNFLCSAGTAVVSSLWVSWWGRSREAWATKPLSVGKLKEAEWPFSPAISVRQQHTRVCVCMFLGLCFCWPECCLLSADQRENLTHTKSSPGRSPCGDRPWLPGVLRCGKERPLLTWTRRWPRARGVEGGGSACQKVPGTDVRGTEHRRQAAVGGTAEGVGLCSLFRLLTFSPRSVSELSETGTKSQADGWYTGGTSSWASGMWDLGTCLPACATPQVLLTGLIRQREESVIEAGSVSSETTGSNRWAVGENGQLWRERERKRVCVCARAHAPFPT